jgi:hypothetical protein
MLPLSASAQTSTRSSQSSTRSSQTAQGASRNASQQSQRPVAEAKADTVRVKGPFFRGLTVSVNIADPLLRAFGQDYGGYEAAIEANLRNRFFPEFSIGVGSADTEADRGFRYKTPNALYGRVGVSYNFRYKVDAPNYFVVALRFGHCSYKADITNIDYSDDYWPDLTGQNLPTQKFSSTWMELGAGIRVKVFRGLSMGWMVWVKPMLKSGATEQAKPWYTPGYGTSSFGFSYNIYYNIPFL